MLNVQVCFCAFYSDIEQQWRMQMQCMSFDSTFTVHVANWMKTRPKDFYIDAGENT